MEGACRWQMSPAWPPLGPGGAQGSGSRQDRSSWPPQEAGQELQPKRSCWAKGKRCCCHLVRLPRPWGKQNPHLFEVLLPRQHLQEFIIEFHLHLCAFDEEHPQVPQDEGNVLPLPQAVRDEGRGASDAALHLLPGHGGSCSHLSKFEGFQLLMAWKTKQEGWSRSPAALPRVFPRCCSLQ